MNFKIQHDDSLSITGIRKFESPKLIPNQANEIKKPDFEMFFPASALYDTVQMLYYRNNSLSTYSVSASQQVNDASVPLHNEITVRIKPDKIIPGDWKDKIMIRRSGRGLSVRKARWEGDWLTEKFGDLGSFQAFADMVPPSVNELGKPARLSHSGGGDTVNLSPLSRILFTPTDNFGIKSFRAELDNQWIRFSNDKSRNWIYEFDERCPYGVHRLKVTVEDLVGNVTEKSWWFKRYPYTPPKKKKAIKKGKGKKQVVSGKGKTKNKK